MKKIILVVLSILAVTLIANGNTFAESYHRNQPVNVYGIVTSEGNKVKNARVTVQCDMHSLATTTNRKGQYSVTFRSWQCFQNNIITVIASKHSSSGESSGKVNWHNNLRLNVAFVNASVPEFGLLSGAGAALIGAATFLTVRRRNLRASEL